MTREDKQKILDMVANGSITPEEAIMLLECLEESKTEAPKPPIAAAPPTCHRTEAAAPAAYNEAPSAAPEQPAQKEAPAAPPAAANTAAQQSPKTESSIPHREAAPSGIPYAPPPPQEKSCSKPPYAENYSSPPPPDAPDFEWENEPEPPESGYRYPYIVPEHEVTAIKISWINGPAIIKTYDGADFRITEYSNNELLQQDALSVSVSGNVLNIKWDQNEKLISFARMLGSAFMSKFLVVEVPRAIAAQLENLDFTSVAGGLHCREFTANRIKLSTTSGKIFAAGLSAQNLKISSVSGSVHLMDCFAENLNVSSTSGAVSADEFSSNIASFDTISGRITCSGNAGHFKSSTVSGKNMILLRTMPDYIKADSISGRVILTIPENSGFTVKYSSLSGILQSDFSLRGNAGLKNGQAVYGDGSTEINFSTLSGRMQIYRG